MPLGRLSIRSAPGNRLHHLWCNNGSWWCHYTLHFDCRKRRIRRSLGTRSLSEAIRRRDELFARIEREGEIVADRRSRGADAVDGRSVDGFLCVMAARQWFSRSPPQDSCRAIGFPPCPACVIS